MQLYTAGEWTTYSSILDSTATEKALIQTLDKLSFQRRQDFVYRGGDAQLYIREHAPNRGSQPPIAFNFCCVLYLGNVLYPIGIKDVQDVPPFLKEIDAHPKEVPDMTIADLMRLQSRVSQSLATLADRLKEPDEVARQLSGLEAKFGQLVTTLTAIEHLLRRGLLQQPLPPLERRAPAQNGISEPQSPGHSQATTTHSRKASASQRKKAWNRRRGIVPATRRTTHGS